ncbi:TonB-dependent receptor [Flavivirga jejuensis]|uniref:TonB-dependent receptor n=1 Tax=Flavivirga jejuensis TaxID=870487 RepID=A0ABT8WSY9_9FLAO|nr:TonB-dependent receptor [Flavivirga jejuensis]MDO5976120.1 TonB-dependent receptor [Flavivirga jejuensis]
MTKLIGQSSISGHILDVNGKNLLGVNLLLKGTELGTISDYNGNFEIKKVPNGNYNLIVSSIGYKKQIIAITIHNKPVIIKILMYEEKEALKEVLLTGKTHQQKKREAPIKIDVISVDKILERATPVTTIINQTSGVKVRQSAGVGSPTIVNINGLQGGAIRFFKNGIPTDYLGRAFQIGLIPSNLISDIEIYKGVLPIQLGADALGGAINIVTKKTDHNFLNTSYSIGAFNTHEASINANYLIPKTKIQAGLSSYYIYSNNNYNFEGPVLNEETQNYSYETVERFHDGIETAFVQGNFGVHDTKYADILNIEMSYFNFNKEIQTGNNITVAIGEATFKETNKIGSITYQKKITSNFKIDLFSAFSKKNTIQKDLSNNKYNWLGAITSTDNFTGGETGDTKTDSNINQESFVARLLASYKINKSLELKLSSTYNSKNQVGTDPYQSTNFTTGIQPITIPSYYKKTVSGISAYSKLFEGKITNEFTFKHFHLNTESANIFGDVLTTEKHNSSFGWGNSTKYKINSDAFLRISFENTTRIPESEEYFGDNLFNLSNANLNPEKSKNLNIGYYSNLNTSKTLFLDINTFYRDTNNFIRKLPVGFVFTQNQNTDTQITKGIESSLKLKLQNNFRANISITYQDMRRVNTGGSAIENSRTPNTPYFFTNLNVFKNYKHPFRLPVFIDLYANYNYTEQYLLTATSKILEPALFERDISFTDLIIPEQHQVDIGFTVKLKKLPISINTEISNLINSKLYDEFRIQKPSRAFRLKVTYKL